MKIGLTFKILNVPTLPENHRPFAGRANFWPSRRRLPKGRIDSFPNRERRSGDRISASSGQLVVTI